MKIKGFSRNYIQGGLAALVLALFGGLAAAAPENGENVVVIFNTRVPESRQVAEYYAERRQVPSGQLLGLKLSTDESMTRAEFVQQLQKPLLEMLREKKLMTFAEGSGRATAATVRYAVLCYGVPTRITKDPALREPGTETLQAELQRNEASVDSELACLPAGTYRVTGPLQNPAAGATNRMQIHPTNGVWVVARLDGPTPDIARGLVDKALAAERDGLWGRTYFDLRGFVDGSYKMGDDWIRTAATISSKAGFEVTIDEKPETFPAGFPLSQIAVYAGWYEGNVSGPFTVHPVEFMPGAIAYHLHSFSAQTIRSTNLNWVGPLLAAGATATLGCVDEPYLSGTPDIATLLSRIYLGFSFGEAACAAQTVLSWQTIAVGDPLYKPFHQRPDLVHGGLIERQSPLLEWSLLRAVNLNLSAGIAADEAMAFLHQEPQTRKSAVLTEKLADLYLAKTKISDAVDLYTTALKRNPSPRQRMRLLLTSGRLLNQHGRTAEAYDIYEKFLTENPGYADLPFIYQTLLPLAEKLGKKEMVERCQRELKRLTTPAPPKL